MALTVLKKRKAFSLNIIFFGTVFKCESESFCCPVPASSIPPTTHKKETAAAAAAAEVRGLAADYSWSASWA